MSGTFDKKPQGSRVVVSVGGSKPHRGDQAQMAREVVHDAREEAFRIKKVAEEEARKINQESLTIEKRIAQKAEEIENELKKAQKQAEELEKRKNSLKKREEDLEKTREELLQKLQKVSSLTKEEVRKEMLANLESQLSSEVAKRIKEAEENIKANSQKIAQDVITNAMIAGATDWVAEYTVSTIKLESEEMKGRIIGKEGRNIRTFELATGVDVDLDSDNPLEVRLSSFDPVRREIARRALDWLVKDARIQPTRIEQLVERAQNQVSQDMSDAGQKAAFEIGLFNLPQAALDALGRLKFRYSYGQNQLIACIETAKIAKKIAVEIGANEIICAMGGLFHDIGKTEVEKEGTHVQLGVELAKKWNFPQEVINCIAQHHEDEPFSSIESQIVHIADAVSGARPGARHEPVEEYMKRLGDIEKIAMENKGVDKAYAIQAGREIRVIVQPEIVDDAGIIKIASDIRQRLESELNYPGQITVTVIRETRAQDIAK